MKKIVPFFTTINRVVLYMDGNKYCVAYNANHIFAKGAKKEALENMPKQQFDDMAGANMFLAKKIYPNIAWDGVVENATVANDPEQARIASQIKGGFIAGDGKAHYFDGNKNLSSHYLSFYMAAEQTVRRQILDRQKQA